MGIKRECRSTSAIAGTTPTKADLAQAIREVRRERSMTMYELAADLHPTTVGPIELGKKSLMWDTLCLLSDGLGITVAGLVRRAEHVAQHRQPSRQRAA
jgi:transcriptional regulator with XRE-family HTH domain